MTTLQERLRTETRPLHAQTEQLFYTDALQAGTLSVKAYTHLLRTHLLFHQALEAAVDQYPAYFEAYTPNERRKADWLLNDLTALAEPLPLPIPDLFRSWTPVALLGAAYVGEGSMLGGTVIWRLLQNSPAVAPLLTNARFFRGYGQATGANWKQFGLFLTQQGEAHADEVVAAAQSTFLAYQAIFRQTGMLLVA